MARDVLGFDAAITAEAAAREAADAALNTRLATVESSSGQPNGLATLDGTGDVPATQLGNVPAVTDATMTTKGINKMSVAPVDPASPIAVGDNDSRMTDARTPTAHKTSHATGGSDVLAPSDIGAAPIASPTFTGDPKAPTPAPGDNDTSIATSAFTKAALDAQANTDVQIFTLAGTWVKPTTRTPKRVRVWAVAGGGSGGGGRKSATGTAAFGGGGGGGGGRTFADLDPSLLGSTEAVTVGAAVTGAPAQATNSTNGANGNNGVATTFGASPIWVSTTPASAGVGGSSTTSGGGQAGNGIFLGGAGAAGGSGVGSAASLVAAGAGGGGGGGGIATTPASAAGGVGAGTRQWGTLVATPADTPGASAGATTTLPGYGGGGGSSNITGNGAPGQPGGFPGGGGGGGAGALDGVGNGGAGGAGGGGICVVITEF